MNEKKKHKILKAYNKNIKYEIDLRYTKKE